MAQDTYYYKILDAAPAEPLPQTLPATSLDANDGFIHLSTAAQVPVTADLYFSSHAELWLLKLRVQDLDGRISIDDEARGCPHLHDSKIGLGASNIDKVIRVERTDSSKWSEVPTMKQLQS